MQTPLREFLRTQTGGAAGAAGCGGCRGRLGERRRVVVRLAVATTLSIEIGGEGVSLELGGNIGSRGTRNTWPGATWSAARPSIGWPARRTTNSNCHRHAQEGCGNGGGTLARACVLGVEEGLQLGL